MLCQHRIALENHPLKIRRQRLLWKFRGVNSNALSKSFRRKTSNNPQNQPRPRLSLRGQKGDFPGASPQPMRKQHFIHRQPIKNHRRQGKYRSKRNRISLVSRNAPASIRPQSLSSRSLKETICYANANSKQTSILLRQSAFPQCEFRIPNSGRFGSLRHSTNPLGCQLFFPPTLLPSQNPNSNFQIFNSSFEIPNSELKKPFLNFQKQGKRTATVLCRPSLLLLLVKVRC